MSSENDSENVCPKCSSSYFEFKTEQRIEIARLKGEIEKLKAHHDCEICRGAEAEIARLKADRDMWLNDDAKQNFALARALAEIEKLKAHNERLRAALIGAKQRSS